MIFCGVFMYNSRKYESFRLCLSKLHPPTNKTVSRLVNSWFLGKLCRFFVYKEHEAKVILHYGVFAKRNLVFSLSVNVQSGSKSCITLIARSAQIFDRCVGIGVGSLDQNLLRDFKTFGCSYQASDTWSKLAGLKNWAENEISFHEPMMKSHAVSAFCRNSGIKMNASTV